MSPSMITAIGVVAAILTTGSWIPQALRIIRRREADDFSWIYLIAFMTGIATWLAYGILKNDIALIFANAVTLALLVPIVIVKVHTERK